MICISETRVLNEVPLSNIQIDGYDFIHTPTLTQCGGSGMYIKNGIEYTILDKLTKCHKDICESIFDELKHPKKKNVIIWSIYRHHTTVESFLDTRKNLQFITKTKKHALLPAISMSTLSNMVTIKKYMTFMMNFPRKASVRQAG